MLKIYKKVPKNDHFYCFFWSQKRGGGGANHGGALNSENTVLEVVGNRCVPQWPESVCIRLLTTQRAFQWHCVVMAMFELVIFRDFKNGETDWKRMLDICYRLISKTVNWLNLRSLTFYQYGIKCCDMTYNISSYRSWSYVFRRKDSTF